MQRYVTSEIRINATVEQILNALLELEHLKSWWGVDSALIEKKDGGTYTITWLRSEHGIKFISTGRIKLYDKTSHLHLEDMIYINSEKPIQGPFTIQYNIKKNNNYCMLSVRQGGFEKGDEQGWYYKAVLDGWPEALIMLKKYLEN